MKDIIDSLTISEHADYLIDTCFLIYCVKKNKLSKLIGFCKENSAAMTSFNLLEIDHVHHKLTGTENHQIRKFLLGNNITKINIEPLPGNALSEREYVSAYSDDALKAIHDPSDAVLLVAAMKIKANILTRDKHHLFTTAAEELISEKGVAVLNEIP